LVERIAAVALTRLTAEEADRPLTVAARQRGEYEHQREQRNDDDAGNDHAEFLQVEDVMDALAPREDEVEALASEERSDDDEHGPEHKEERHDRDGELTILRFVGRVLVDVARECKPGEADTRDH